MGKYGHLSSFDEYVPNLEMNKYNASPFYLREKVAEGRMRGSSAIYYINFAPSP